MVGVTVGVCVLVGVGVGVGQIISLSVLQASQSIYGVLKKSPPPGFQTYVGYPICGPTTVKQPFSVLLFQITYTISPGFNDNAGPERI